MLRIDLVTLVVDDYDRAIGFYVGVLGFVLTEDTDLGDGKRWVVVRPSTTGNGLLLAEAATRQQSAAIGNQAGGRVAFFLHTDDIDRDVQRWGSLGVEFLERVRDEPYGRVTVFADLYGNHWDLIQPPATRVP